MAENPISRLKASVTTRPYRRRSDIYRWLRAHHAAVVELLEKEPAWQVVAAELEALGLKGATGGRPTGRGVRRIWNCVCRDVALEAARATANNDRGLVGSRAPRMPSKTAADRQPLEAGVTARTHEPAGTDSTAAPSPGVPQDAPALRPLKIFRSLADIKPLQPQLEPEPAPDPGASGMLGPPRWPKPVM